MLLNGIIQLNSTQIQRIQGQVQGVVVEGFRSLEDKVLSGVPQGTVLGPLLVLLHINDLPSVIRQIRLFVDDCLI